MGAEPNDGFRRVLVSSETEIKFAVEKGRKTEGVGRGNFQAVHLRNPLLRHRQFDLRRHRVELCVRKRDGQVIQKIKTRQANGSLIGCQSHEIILSDLEPNLEHARALFAPDLRDVISPSALKPQFRTRFSRISHQFATDSCITRGFVRRWMYRGDQAQRIDFRGRVHAQGRQARFPHAGRLSFLAEVPAALLSRARLRAATGLRRRAAAGD